MKTFFLSVLITTLVHAGTVLPVSMLLPAGVHDYPGGNVTEGCSWIGAVDSNGYPTTIINIPNGIDIRVNNVTIENVILQGTNALHTGIWIEKSGGLRNMNLTIQNVVFRNLARNAIQWTSGVSYSKFTDLSAENVKGWLIYGENWDHTTITACEGIKSGIHINANGDPASNAGNTIEQVYVHGLDGAGLEIQGAPKDTIIQDNDYDTPTNVTNRSKYAYSVPTAGGIHTQIHRNRAVMPTNSQQWPTTLIIFETGGLDLDVSDNYSNGGNDVLANNGVPKNGVGTGSVKNNRFLNFNHMTGNNFGSVVSFSNNTPTTQLTWNINRPHPGPRKRYETAVVTPPTDPRDQQIIDMQKQIDNLINKLKQINTISQGV